MTIRSLVLFAHVAAVLALFIGLAFEWLSLASLRQANTAEQARPWIKLHGVVPRLYGLASPVLLLSGIYMARGGLFNSAWVRVPFALLILIGIVGGPAIRSQVRAMREATGNWRQAVHPRLFRSLFMRAAMALAAVYVMIGKPQLTASLLVAALAIAAGLTLSFISTAAESPSLPSEADLKRRSA
jgi:hypothetical protein